MWYFILLSSFVGCADHYSEEYLSYIRARGTGDEYMESKGEVAQQSHLSKNTVYEYYHIPDMTPSTADIY
jgi:hypothetical protein